MFGGCHKILYAMLILLTFVACNTEEELLPPHATETEYTCEFDEVWNTLDSFYVFFDLLPCDWDSLHKAYYYRVESVKTDEQFEDMMKEMLEAIEDPYIYYKHKN